MNMWEREHAVVARVKETMINVCKRDFELMENQISKIEGKYEVKITLKQRDIAASGDSVHVTTIHRSCSLLVRGFPIVKYRRHPLVIYAFFAVCYQTPFLN